MFIISGDSSSIALSSSITPNPIHKNSDNIARRITLLLACKTALVEGAPFLCEGPVLSSLHTAIESLARTILV